MTVSPTARPGSMTASRSQLPSGTRVESECAAAALFPLPCPLSLFPLPSPLRFPQD